MQLFSKQKGVFWKIINGILLAAMLISAVVLIYSLVDAILPAQGDYSNVRVNSVVTELLTCIGLIGLDFLTLFLINKKINLFDKSYPLSRKWLNFWYLLAALGAAEIAWGCIISMIMYNGLNNSVSSILVPLAIVASYLITLWLANRKPILIMQNGKALNFVNLVGIGVCSNMIMTVFVTLVNIDSSANTIDIIRTILIALMIFGIFAAVIYFVNFRHHKNQDAKIPDTFNDKSLNSDNEKEDSKKSEQTKDFPKPLE